MKKILYCSFLVILIILFHSYVFAESDQPVVEPFFAIVKNEDGAESYSYTYNGNNDARLSASDKVEFETKIRVQSEMIKNGTLYCQYTIPDSSNFLPKYIKADDIEIDAESAITSITPNYLEPYTFTIINEKGVSIHKGPAYTYEIIGKTIPYSTIMTAYKVSEDEKNPWYYIDYQGVSGFICDLYGELGHTTKEIKSMITPLAVNVYSKTSDQRENIREKSILEPNTIISNFLEIDKWSDMYYLPNERGYINIKDVAVIRQQVYDRIFEVPEGGLTLYETADSESDVVLENIPENTTITGKYEQFDITEGGWINISYEGKTGWIYLSKEQIEESNVKSDEQYGEFKKIDDARNSVSDSNEIIDDTTIPTDEAKKVELSNNEGTPLLTIICIIAGIILAIASIVLFIISKKK